LLFDSFGLDRRLLRAVNTAGWVAPTPVQEQTIPPALSGQDLMACARTGSGKTGAFALPALQQLLRRSAQDGRGPRMLTLCPTRELAQQVSEQVAELGRYTRLRSGSIVGGEPYPPQIRLLGQPLDLLVATPGRLMDHMRSGRVDFGRLEMLVLDEADRMLDMGFIDDVLHIASATPPSRQTLLFSATLEGEVLVVAERLLRDPVRIEVDLASAKHEDIEEYVLRADNDGHKQSLLLHIVRDPELSQGIVFVGTKGKADEQAALLRMAAQDVEALHGDMHQSKRNRVVDKLRDRKLRLVVATYVAARCLDIEGVSHVINFYLPGQARDYVHRIGRTGRAGQRGVAVSLVTPTDWIKLSDIERMRGHRLQRRAIPGLEPTRPEPRAAASTDSTAGKRRYAGRRGGGVRRRQRSADPDPEQEG
jgi:superfamily II DNA/RNA helicase